MVVSDLNLISIKRVMAKTNMSRPSIYRKIATDDFPPPVKVGRSSSWVEKEIDAWIGGLMKKREIM